MVREDGFGFGNVRSSAGGINYCFRTKGDLLIPLFNMDFPTTVFKGVTFLTRSENGNGLQALAVLSEVVVHELGRESHRSLFVHT